MNDQSSSSLVTDKDGIKFEEFYKYLFDITDKDLLSLINNNSLIETYRILPFMIKSNSTSIFPIEDQTNKNLVVL